MTSRLLFLSLVLISLSIRLISQNTTTRYFNRTYPSSNYAGCNFSKIEKTGDNGFILSYNPFSPNLHGPYPVDYFTIKVDSNFTPQWITDVSCGSLKLSNSTFVLYHNNTIQVRSNNGNLKWAKKFNDYINIYGAIGYNNKIILIGSVSIPNLQYLIYQEHSFISEIDTLGNLIYASRVYSSVNNLGALYTIKSIGGGNFIIRGSDNAFLSKYNVSNGFYWSKILSNPQHLFQPNAEIELLQNGDFLISGAAIDTATSEFCSAFLKYSSTGNLLYSKRFPSIIRNVPSNLTKINANAYMGTFRYINSNYSDTVGVFLVDSNVNLKHQQFSLLNRIAGTPYVNKPNQILIPGFSKEPSLSQVDSLGNNICLNNVSNVALSNYLNFPLLNSTLTTSNYPVAFITCTVYPLYPVNYYNSCNITSEVRNLETNATNITLFPNPCINHLNVKFTNLNESQKVSYSIKNLLGQSVYEKEGENLLESSLSINTTGFKNGIYVITIKTESGLIVQKKFLVAR